MEEQSAARIETYTFGYGILALWMEERTIATHASFIVSELKSGMSVLDCGCGRGFMTVDIAARVSPGVVTAIDIQSDELDRARILARSRNIDNVRFVAGTVYKLPFDDAAFDLVYAYTLLQHIADPLAALREIRRVLRPGGKVALCDDDWGSVRYFPQNDAIERAYALYLRNWQHNGGDPFAPIKYRRWLRQAGFTQRVIRGELHLRRTRDSTAQFALGIALHLGESVFQESVVRLGWADRESIEQAQQAFISWGQDPDAFHSISLCSAVATKPL